MNEYKIVIRYELPFWLGVEDGDYELKLPEEKGGLEATLKIFNHFWLVRVKKKDGDLLDLTLHENEVINYNNGEIIKQLSKDTRRKIKEEHKIELEPEVFYTKKLKTFIEWVHNFNEENVQDPKILDNLESQFLEILNYFIFIYKAGVEFNHTVRLITDFDLHSQNTMFFNQIYQDGMPVTKLITKMREFPHFQNVRVLPNDVLQLRDVLKSGKVQRIEWFLYRKIRDHLYFLNSRDFCIDVIHLIDILSTKIIKKTGKIDDAWIEPIMSNIQQYQFMKKLLPLVVKNEMGKDEDYWIRNSKALDQVRKKRNQYIHGENVVGFTKEKLLELRERMDEFFPDLFFYLEIPLPHFNSKQLPSAISLESSAPNKLVQLKLIEHITEFFIKQQIHNEYLKAKTDSGVPDFEITWRVDSFNFCRILLKKIRKKLYAVTACYKKELFLMNKALKELDNHKDKNETYYSDIENVEGAFHVTSQEDIDKSDLNKGFQPLRDWFESVAKNVDINYFCVKKDEIKFK